MKFGGELWILQVCRLLNRTWSCVKETLWIQLKQFYLTVHWFLFAVHDLPVAKRFSSWLWRLPSTMLLLTMWILTCTYKGQAAPTVIESERVRTLTPAKYSEKNLTFKLQNSVLSRARTSANLKVNLTSLQTQMWTSVLSQQKEKEKKNQTTKRTKDPRETHLSGVLLFKRLVDCMERVTFGFLSFQNK